MSDNGKLVSKRGITTEFDFALVWSDAAIAFRVMASGSTEKFVEAIFQNKLNIEGEGMDALWFLQLTKDMDY